MGRKKVVNPGDKFNRLTAIKEVGRSATGHDIWLWKCDCGNEKEIERYAVVRGTTKSCGCFAHEVRISGDIRRKHGGCGTRLYSEWKHMRRRCLSPKSPDYNDYGGRGITICEEWLLDYATFRDWALANGYSDNLSLDRINVNGNYEPTNCRWATDKEQARNKRKHTLIEYNGESKLLSEWAEIFNLPLTTLRSRYYQYGWRGEKLFQPKAKG